MKTKTNGTAEIKRRPYFELIQVREVKPLDGFMAHFIFTDGSERDIDLDQYLDGGVFEPIRNDPQLFRNMFVEGGTITWPGEVDIAPETLYYGETDPPWVKYDKEQELKGQPRERAPRSRTTRKSVNGKTKLPRRSAVTKTKAKTIKARSSKPGASRKKTRAKK